MRFAIVNGMKVEATPKAKGICSNCRSELIARCGRVKVWHWAHKGFPPCDPWWEAETKWHRNWKSCFPKEWQEVSHVDPVTGEKHIADVKTPFGLVIEFQHSPIKPEECASRERFYKKMIWVVDGNRAQSDRYYFEAGLRQLEKDRVKFQIRWEGPSGLLRNWSESRSKVFIDFGQEWFWKLVKFDQSTKIGTVEAVPKISLERYINERIGKQDVIDAK